MSSTRPSDVRRAETQNVKHASLDEEWLIRSLAAKLSFPFNESLDGTRRRGRRTLRAFPVFSPSVRAVADGTPICVNYRRTLLSSGRFEGRDTWRNEDLGS